MDLIHNATFRLLPTPSPDDGYASGIYRVILDLPATDTTVAVLIQPDEPLQANRGGRPRILSPKIKRKKKPAPLVGGLIWMDRTALQRWYANGLLKPLEIERDTALMVAPQSAKAKLELERRQKAMAAFLDFERLTDGITVHHGLGGLVREAMLAFGVSRAYVYSQWSNLCRFGIHAVSLAPRYDRCGSPGIPRYCAPGQRQKPGRKTKKQSIAAQYGQRLAPEQPGMSMEWAAAILAADKAIPIPKPSYRKRCIQIVQTAFVSKARSVDGRIEFVAPEPGTYPNDRQIIRVLTERKTKLERLLERTTKTHFERARRGLTGRSWENTSGPGHTWAIDSTIGDIYLRSSINRNWIIGRPVVYVIVDIWSTAVVGFHVCLTGPSWDTASVALFNSAAGTQTLNEITGHQAIQSLFPEPTLPHAILCDRGEMLSRAQRNIGAKLIPVTSITPPYRGDLKGLVEVLHRIEKNEQFQFIPGAMDYRREELELRRADPLQSVMTLQEYIAYLHELFAEYNLTANRRNRVDAYMVAATVPPNPAGLWQWGHAQGIGVRRHVDPSDLITSLLPAARARVRRDCVRFAQCDYMSPEVKSAHWTTLARNDGGWDIPITHYPGSMSHIWTPNVAGAGLMRLALSPYSKVSGTASFDEYLDCWAYDTMRQPDVEHLRKVHALDFYRRRKRLVEVAKGRTAAALKTADRDRPTISEARLWEWRGIAEQADDPPITAVNPPTLSASDESVNDHNDMMAALLRAMDAGDAQ